MQKTDIRKTWKMRHPNVSAAMDAKLSYHPVIARLLVQRGIETEEAAERFFKMAYERDLHDPFLFRQMEAAVSRIFQAIDANERITIHGDYDADGVTGSAVLTNTIRDLLRAKGKPVDSLDFYIPHREREGYGIHDATVDLLAERGTKLLITVDCGIACRSQISKAREKGIETIVVDHHEFPPELPEAILIHPRLPGETYPFPYLAAVGVAWKVASALYVRAREQGLAVHPQAEKWLLDLVAIATVTDVVPLVGENRALEHFGLMVLRKTKRLGFLKLYEVARIEASSIDTWTVGFQIGPRINAAGRMEHAEAAFRMLIAETEEEALLYAKKIHEQNILRQQESGRMYEEARKQLLERSETALLWAYAENWSPGLVGLVAGKLVQEFGKPVLVMGRVGERIIGSGRSVPGFHITEALRSVAEHLERFGGHPQACGFTAYPDDRLGLFVNGMVAIAAEQTKIAELIPTLLTDAEITFGEISPAVIDLLERFAPFGEGNPTPVFLTKTCSVVQADMMGAEGKHLRILLRDERGITQKCVAFGHGADAAQLTPGRKIDIAYEIGWNEWNGRKDIQCKMVDWRFSNETKSLGD
ncbi:MAG: single-stranded-DNA-specific exonuclease RecJ [bacterium]|nr:single-stranded-DNA-specific exonuclease RecJ [bacterium]